MRADGQKRVRQTVGEGVGFVEIDACGSRGWSGRGGGDGGGGEGC